MTHSNNGRIGFAVWCLLLTTSFTTSTWADCVEWKAGPSLVQARAAPAAVRSPNGDLLVAGGTAQPQNPPPYIILDSVEILSYDRATGKYAAAWQAGPVLPQPRMSHGMTVSGRFVYIVGGCTGGPNPIVLGNLRLDTLALPLTWTGMASLQVPRFGGAVATDHLGRVWISGGVDQRGATVATVEYYDPYQPELGWQMGPALPAPRAYAGAEVDARGNLIVFGGRDTTGKAVSEVFLLDPTNLAAGWRDVGDIPGSPSPDVVAASGADGHIYLPGGWLPGFVDRVFRYDPTGRTWKDWAHLGRARNNHVVVLGLDNQLYVIGGNSHTEWPTASVERLTTSFIVGDINDDGCINFADINPFVDLLDGYW